MKICGIVTGNRRTSKGKRRLELKVGREKTYLYIGEYGKEGGLDAYLLDTVRFSAIISPVANFTEDFDYVSLLARNGIFTTAYCQREEIEISHRQMNNRSERTLLRLRSHEFLDEYLSKGLPDDEAATLKSLLLGDREDMSEEMVENYRRSGAMHIMAVSGLHVGIIYMMVRLLLSLIPAYGKPIRFLKGMMAMIALVFYAWICGMGASVCRAVLTAAIYEAGIAIEGRKCPLGAVSLSALLICIFNPCAPATVGFQLSYSAVLGISAIYPLLGGMLATKSKLLKYIWKTVSISIACQIGTAAVTLYHFKTFPKYFLITNMVSITLVNIIMYSVIPALAISAIPFTAYKPLTFVGFFLKTLNYFIKIIAEM
jgi:competence protein ComEC